MAIASAFRQKDGLVGDRSRVLLRPLVRTVSWQSYMPPPYDRPLSIGGTVPPNDPPVLALFERYSRCYHYVYNDSCVPNTCRECGAIEHEGGYASG